MKVNRVKVEVTYNVKVKGVTYNMKVNRVTYYLKVNRVTYNLKVNRKIGTNNELLLGLSDYAYLFYLLYFLAFPKNLPYFCFPILPIISMQGLDKGEGLTNVTVY